jgi:alkylation response protein AidB-like acyl-CoA dehydrogenase
MNFSFTEEQDLYRETVSRFVQDRYGFEQRQDIVHSDLGMSKENWSLFAELGLLAVPFADEFGGLGGSAIDTMVVMEEFGRGMVVEPYFETVILSGGLLSVGGTPSQKQEFIPKVISGELILATAFAESQSRFNLADIKTTAIREGDGFVLNGEKIVVWAGPWADYLLVTARTSGDQFDENGISLFMVDKNSDGLIANDYPTLDGGRASDVVLDNVKVSSDALIGVLDDALVLIEEVFDRARAALCAEAVGAMKALRETTLEYAKDRKQFGVPIGSFQVIQHRLVDMLIACEEAVSVTYMATLRLAESPSERQKAVSAAKAKVGRVARSVGQESVQIHGAMGMTDELNVGHYFKRLTMIDVSLGNVDYHTRRFAELTQ